MKKMTKRYNVRLLVLLVVMVLSGAPTAFSSDMACADSAYVRGDYEKAVAAYREVLERDGISARLLYNMGNAYYMLGNDGDAMLCYERARRIDPGNAQVAQNLHFLQSKVIEANKGELKGKAISMDADHESFIESLYRMIAVESRSDSWAVLAVIAFLLFLGGAVLYVFTPNVLARKTGFFSGLVFLGFTVVFVIFAFMAASNFHRQDEAVIKAFSTELLESPRFDSKPTSTPLHKGTKVKILEEKTAGDGSRWVKVKLNSDNVGWMRGDQMEVI